VIFCVVVGGAFKNIQYNPVRGACCGEKNTKRERKKWKEKVGNEKLFHFSFINSQF
jgi:hypothetical protein